MSRGVQFCQHKNYEGRCVTWDVGRYNRDQVKSYVGNDAISSIRIITPGYYAKTYKGASFNDGQKDFAADAPNLKAFKWGDTISSVEVVDGNPKVDDLPPVITPTPALAPSPAPAPVQVPALVSAPPPVPAPAPPVENDEWSTGTWVMISIFILFFLLIIVGGLVYLIRHKVVSKQAAIPPRD